MVPSELAKVAVVKLRSDPELIGHAGRGIESEVSESGAALTAVHRQPIVGIRVDKALRGESVYLHFAVEELEVLRVQ
jgi:hypothetical protein